nr:hypothetical protein [Tanacetum cinerariifolium]
MTGNIKLLINFVEKFLGTVKFGNDQIAPILGFKDLVQGVVTIKRVYYVDGLNHNLFSIGQFCDADLEVAFRKSTCYIRDLKGNDLLTDKKVPISEGSPVTRTESHMETYKTVSQDIHDQLNAEAEAVQIILTRIDNDIYSTVDACPNACEMWKAIERAERIAHVANPLALVAQQQPVYQPQTHPTHYTHNSSTRSQQAATRNRGKVIVNSPQPIYDQEPSMVAEDNKTSKDKEIDKLMALISLSFKKIYKPTNNNLRTSSNTNRANQDNFLRINRSTGYENQRIGNVAGARETKPKRVKDATYHREKMLLCKQEEARIQLNAKQADWRDDTDDELEDQELEAHYMYMAQLQEVSPDAADSGPIFDTEPVQKSQQKEAQIKLYKTCEDKELDKVIALENKVKFLKKAQRVNPRLYDIERSRLSHTPVNNGNSKESFHKQTTLLEKRMDESILRDQKCKSSIELFKIKSSVGTIIDGVERCKETIAKRSYFGHIDPFIKNTIEANFSQAIRRINAGIEQFYVCLNEEMVADLRYFNSLEPELVEIVLFIVDSGCSKHMTGNLKLLINFLENFIGTVKFRNDQIAHILGYGDLVQGAVMIKRVYYVKGLNHNLFSVGQLCDADLEVAFQKSTCYLHDLKGNDLLTATSSQAWLWHRRLSHLNFDTINLLSKNDIVVGLLKLKFVKDHLCSSCKLGKAKRKSKDETPEVLIDFLRLVQRGLQAQVRIVRTDKGTKFLNQTLHSYFAAEGILHQTSVARTPEQNRVVERRN